MKRVIDVIKLIGKKDLNKSAYMFNNLSIDHENFLDIPMLLGKYDNYVNEHLKSIIEKSEKAHESGSKERGSLIIFISKTILYIIIDSIFYCIKKIYLMLLVRQNISLLKLVQRKIFLLKTNVQLL